MRTRSLGTEGPEVSVVGLGCNNFGMRSTRRGTARSWTPRSTRASASSTPPTSTAAGGSEELLGQALGGRRDDVVLATKFGMADGRRRAAGAGGSRTTCAARRGRPAAAGTDWIDLYQHHVPDAGHADRGDARRAGRARRRGQGAHDRLLELRAGRSRGGRGRARKGPRLRQRPERATACWTARRSGRRRRPASASDVGVLPYFPLASGLLTGKYRRGEPAPAGTRLAMRRQRRHRRGLRRARGAEAFAKERGHTMLELAFAGLLAQPAAGVGDRRRDEARAGAHERC